uniref:Small ribosomal subunit protein bS16m n=1 Tax=Clastoptera arizonana TaxID=38151 RepID=A0A1B6CJJ8_9HEMI
MGLIRGLPKLINASGGGRNSKYAPKSIRFQRHGCTNRPFYHIVVAMTSRDKNSQPIEQLGTYDPIPNVYNEKLVSFNFERIGYWIGEGATISKPVAELLGLSGYLPIHPNTYLFAWRERRKVADNEANNDDSKQIETNSNQ